MDKTLFYHFSPLLIETWIKQWALIVSPIQKYEEYTKRRKGKAIGMVTWTNDVRCA
jgi:hypothetical protein